MDRCETEPRTAWDMAANRRRVLLGGAGVAAAAALPAGARAGEDGVLDCLIIGAGLAGLTAARDLVRSGNESFLILEARDRVGGRTLNHRLREGRFSEAGGQWTGPGQTAVADLARELGVGTFDSDYRGSGVILWDDARLTVDGRGGVDISPSIKAKLERLAATTPCDAPWTAPDAERLDRTTTEQWLKTEGASDLDLFTFRIAALMTVGAAPGAASLLHYLSMLNFAGGFEQLEAQKGGAQQTRFRGGSQILSLKLAEALGDKVVLNAPVARISGWNGRIVTVETAKGVYKARQLIMALSPPLCGQIAFDPPLPPARAELQRRWPTHGAQFKTAMVYPRPTWFDRGYNGQVASLVGPVVWSYDNSPEDKSVGVINAFVRIGDLPPDRDAARAAVAKIYARALQDDRLNHPDEFHMIDWGAETYTLTCISPLPPGLLTSGLMPALKAPCGAVHWAGTETAELWMGYMDGAVRSGHRAALQTLQALRKGAA
jgi:monoamine oxidase